jgi:hypothetical protein
MLNGVVAQKLQSLDEILTELFVTNLYTARWYFYY